MKDLTSTLNLSLVLIITALSNVLSAQNVDITIKSFPSTDFSVYWTSPGPEGYYRESFYSGQGYFMVDIEEAGKVKSAPTFCIEPVEWAGSLNEKLEYVYVDGPTYYNSAYQSDLINHPQQAPIDPNTYGIITEAEKMLIAKVWNNVSNLFDNRQNTVAMQMMIWELVCDQDFDMYSGNFSIDPDDMEGIKVNNGRSKKSQEIKELIDSWKKNVDDRVWLSFTPLAFLRNNGKQDLVAEIDIQAEFGISGVSGNLPVEWLNLDAVKTGPSIVRIDWRTSQEINNDRFEIEKKTSQGTFTTIGTVSGNGTTDQISTYTFTDRGTMAEYVYYRIKQIDLDGTFEYSKTLEVKFKQVTQEVNVYPNPAANQLNLTTYFQGKHRYKILSLSGHIIQTGTYDNTFQTERINIAPLKSGRYLIQINLPDGTQINRHFIKR